jgi:hypothetical protein
VRAAARVAVGLLLGDRGLAQQVDGGGDPVLPQVAQHAQGVLGRVAHDEAVGHAAHARRGGRSQGRAPGTRIGHPHRAVERRRAVVDLLQEAGQVAGQIVQ